MEMVRFLVGVVLPYVAIVMFLGGMAYRIYSWKKLASPPMTLFPAAPDEKANALNTMKEVLFFKSLLKGDRVLWAFAWAFHAVLLLIFIGHFRVFANLDAVLMKLGMSQQAISAMSSGAGGAAGIVILLATVLLLARRMAVPRVRQITGPADYLALLLLAAIILTGNMMRFGGGHFDLGITHQYFRDLAMFGNVVGSEALKHNVFLVHFGLALLLILCLPFSKILHLGGIFFTHSLIRKQ